MYNKKLLGSNKVIFLISERPPITRLNADLEGDLRDRQIKYPLALNIISPQIFSRVTFYGDCLKVKFTVHNLKIF